MNSIEVFKNTFLIDSKEHISPLKSIKIFQDNKTIYILREGLIKKKTKSLIETLYPDNFQEKVFVSLVKNREIIKKQGDKVLLDTYVWFADEPKHTVHYTSAPNLKPRQEYLKK